MKCYGDELNKSDGRCNNEADYEARLGWSNQEVWFLCKEHVAEEREFDDIIWVRSLQRDPSPQ